MRQLGPAGTVDTSLRIVCAQPHAIDATLRRHMIDLTQYRARGNDSARAYHDAIRSLFAYTTRGMTADLRAITAPTLVVHGALDRLVPVSLARGAARRRPDWTLEVFEHCGHVPMMEQPERFVDVVAGWAETHVGYDSEVGSSR
jgi:pimeloyl-ACP methyl ester carboxylesterase